MANEQPPKRPRRGRPPKNSTPNNPNPTSSNGSTSSITLPKVDDLKQKSQVDLKANSKIGFDGSKGTVDFKPDNWGLPKVDDDFINKQLKFEPFQTVNDITNPEGLKTVDESTYNKAKHVYEGAIRYRDLEIQHSKYVAKSFQSLVEAFNALAAGFGSKIAFQKAKQKFIDVCKEEQITEEKIIGYINQVHKTGTAKANLPYQVIDRENTLEENRLKALKSSEKLKESQADAENFINGLDKKDGKTK